VRQIFSIRFFAAIGAVALLGAVTFALFVRGDDGLAEVADPEPLSRRVELVEAVFSVVTAEGGAVRESADVIGDDGVVDRGFELVLDAERRLRVFPGTVGEITCERLDEVGRCAVVADLLGEAVVWFSLTPLGPSRTVEMPAILDLEGGLARLENGVRVPYANRLRRVCDEDFASFTAFRTALGTDFVSIYDLDEGQLTDVVCTPPTPDN
jgi:hypothetical protein